MDAGTAEMTDPNVSVALVSAIRVRFLSGRGRECSCLMMSTVNESSLSC